MRAVESKRAIVVFTNYFSCIGWKEGKSIIPENGLLRKF